MHPFNYVIAHGENNFDRFMTTSLEHLYLCNSSKFYSTKLCSIQTLSIDADFDDVEFRPLAEMSDCIRISLASLTHHLCLDDIKRRVENKRYIFHNAPYHILRHLESLPFSVICETHSEYQAALKLKTRVGRVTFQDVDLLFSTLIAREAVILQGCQILRNTSLRAKVIDIDCSRVEPDVVLSFSAPTVCVRNAAPQISLDFLELKNATITFINCDLTNAHAKIPAWDTSSINFIGCIVSSEYLEQLLFAVHDTDLRFDGCVCAGQKMSTIYPVDKRTIHISRMDKSSSPSVVSERCNPFSKYVLSEVATSWAFESIDRIMHL